MNPIKSLWNKLKGLRLKKQQDVDQEEELRQLSDGLKELIPKILEMSHIKESKYTGVFVSIFDKKSGDLLLGKTFGLLTLDEMEKERALSHQGARWLIEHPDVHTSFESNNEVLAGGVSGRKYIVFVSAIEPMDASALAILTLTWLEYTEEDYFLRDKYIRRAECWDQLYDILDFLDTIYKIDFFDRFDAF